jgi:hypothetical protein
VDHGGHIVSTCTPDQYTLLLNNITYTYKWKLNGKFSLDELIQINKAGQDIKSYADKITKGKGLTWMNYYMGGATFEHGGLFGGSNSYVSGSTIHLTSNWLIEGAPHLAHELAHVWDNHTGTEYHHSEAIWFGGGASDYVQEVLGGGKVSGLRWANGSNSNLPSDYQFPKGAYANHSTADYFADTFKYMIYDPIQLSNDVPGSADLVTDMQTLIEVQASHH